MVIKAKENNYRARHVPNCHSKNNGGGGGGELNIISLIAQFKIRPGQIIILASWSWPMRDCKSCLVQDFPASPFPRLWLIDDKSHLEVPCNRIVRAVLSTLV